MGQKVHPIGFRLGIIKTWNSRWYAEKEFPQFVVEDKRIRQFIKDRLYHAGISKIEIERAANRVRIKIHTARPGIVIGKKGAEIEKLKKELEKLRNFLKKCEEEFKKVVIELDEEILKLALSIAKKLVFKEISSDVEPSLRVIKEALKYIAEGSKVKVKVNPEEFELIIPPPKYKRGFLEFLIASTAFSICTSSGFETGR